MSLIFQVILFAFPWNIRRRLLCAIYGYTIDRTARIGLSIINSKTINLSPFSKIGHLNMIKSLQGLMLGESAKIGNLNWITGFTDTSGSKHFAEELGRKSILSLGAHSAITHRHLIDCTNAVTIGKFSTFGGWRSQILTHGIDVRSSRQSSAPVAIGEFCFISTSCVMLKGSRLPDYSLLAAGAVMTAAATEKYGIYGGVPAKKISELDPSDLYFHRTDGYVW